MEISEALFMAASVAAIYLYFMIRNVAQFDFSARQPENRKQAKCIKMLAYRDTPLQGANLRRNLRKAFEKILIPLSRADKGLLPPRMDLNFRRRIEGQIEQLARQGLCRDIRLIDVVPLPQNDFQRWNDDGREWREAQLQCCALERFLPTAGGQAVREIYRKNACLRVVQSRHIRSSDRTEGNNSYYANKTRINCPSCGAQLQLSSQKVVCPYCGGVIESDFYDWQTETFELYEEISDNLFWALLLLISASILFVCVFLCLWLIADTQISLTAGVGAALLVVTAIFLVIYRRGKRQEKLAGKILDYSENYLRWCINEALYKEKARPDRMDYSVGTIRLKKVVNTEDTTTVRARVHIRETYLPAGRKPYTQKRRRTLTLQRARHPEKRRSDGSFFAEKECPSCGANFVPDANHCCSFCGYGLQVENSKWTLKKPGRDRG